jgi:hypothetical protein
MSSDKTAKKKCIPFLSCFSEGMLFSLCLFSSGIAFYKSGAVSCLIKSNTLLYSLLRQFSRQEMSSAPGGCIAVSSSFLFYFARLYSQHVLQLP